MRGKRQLGPLVVPTVHVLHKAWRALLGLGRQVAHGPLVIEPHVVAKHAHVKEVVQVLASGDKRVKGHTGKGAGVQGHKAAAHVVGARDAGARERLFHPAVELDALGPPTMADTHLVRGSQRGSVAIVEVPALDQNRQALARLLTQRVDRAFHKVGVDDGLIVVQKDNRVVAEHGGAGKPHVANGAVTAQAHALARALGRDLRHAVGNARCLGIGDHGDLERGVRVDDFAHAPGHIDRGRDRADHQKDDPRNVAHLLERGQAAVELGIGGVELR